MDLCRLGVLDDLVRGARVAQALEPDRDELAHLARGPEDSIGDVALRGLEQLLHHAQTRAGRLRQFDASAGQDVEQQRCVLDAPA